MAAEFLVRKICDAFFNIEARALKPEGETQAVSMPADHKGRNEILATYSLEPEFFPLSVFIDELSASETGR
jgi:hypothetical protein